MRRISAGLVSITAMAVMASACTSPTNKTSYVYPTKTVTRTVAAVPATRPVPHTSSRPVPASQLHTGSRNVPAVKVQYAAIKPLVYRSQAYDFVVTFPVLATQPTLTLASEYTPKVDNVNNAEVAAPSYDFLSNLPTLPDGSHCDDDQPACTDDDTMNYIGFAVEVFTPAAGQDLAKLVRDADAEYNPTPITLNGVRGTSANPYRVGDSFYSAYFIHHGLIFEVTAYGKGTAFGSAYSFAKSFHFTS